MIMENKEFVLGKVILLNKLPFEKIFTPKSKQSYRYVYKGNYLCFCGNNFVARIVDVNKGKIQSCGCYNKYKVKNLNYIDGRRSTRLNSIYLDIKRRTTDFKRQCYALSGGRGITMCDEWKNDYILFKKWALANGYNEKLTIDRIDVDGNYEPGNCRWISMQHQSFNRRKYNYKTSSIYKGVSFDKKQKYVGSQHNSLQNNYILRFFQNRDQNSISL